VIPTGKDGERAPFVLAVASGKGGTGKTLVATNVAVLAAATGLRVVLADCDVEAPNDHLFLRGVTESTSPVEVPVAEVDPAACSACGRCRDACAYGAVRILGASAIVFEELCKGCGLCMDVCLEHAVQEVPRRVGEVVSGRIEARPGLSLLTGRLDVGQVKSPAVIRSVRKAAAAAGGDVIVLDAPPGVACSAVAAVRDVDMLLLVTEPTAFGLHDLELSLRLGRDLGLPMAVVLNRVGTGHADVDGLCRSWDVPIVARIPFDRQVARVYARGGLVADELPEVARVLSDLLDTVPRVARHETMVR
jgi:MinD superfamily P-loop ATPase